MKRMITNVLRNKNERPFGPQDVELKSMSTNFASMSDNEKNIRLMCGELTNDERLPFPVALHHSSI